MGKTKGWLLDGILTGNPQQNQLILLNTSGWASVPANGEGSNFYNSFLRPGNTFSWQDSQDSWLVWMKDKWVSVVLGCVLTRGATDWITSPQIRVLKP